MKIKSFLILTFFALVNTSLFAASSPGGGGGGLGLIDNNPMVELPEFEPVLVPSNLLPYRPGVGAIDKGLLNQVIRLNPENFKEISEQLDKKRLNLKSVGGLKSFEKVAGDEGFVLVESTEGELAGIEAVESFDLETNGAMLVDEVEVTIELAE